MSLKTIVSQLGSASRFSLNPWLQEELPPTRSRDQHLTGHPCGSVQTMTPLTQLWSLALLPASVCEAHVPTPQGGPSG